MLIIHFLSALYNIYDISDRALKTGPTHAEIFCKVFAIATLWAINENNRQNAVV